MRLTQSLEDQGIDTTGMRPMGSAKGTMSVFAKRLKNGRSWVEKGQAPCSPEWWPIWINWHE